MNHFIAITINYEPANLRSSASVDWENEIFRPTQKLLDLFHKQNIHFTFMAEMGIYFLLREFKPSLAVKMEDQWAEAAAMGNDVQLLLQPRLLPKSGGLYENGECIGNTAIHKTDDYEGDLDSLIKQCKEALESTLCKVDPDYRVTSFRAGNYQAQPFKRLSQALSANQIFCDSSVLPHQVSEAFNYDYSLAYSTHQPYFANPYDPQLKALPAENDIIELPVFNLRPNNEWLLKSADINLNAKKILKRWSSVFNRKASPRRKRIERRLKDELGINYASLKKFHRWVNPLIPKPIAHLMTFHETEALVKDSYFVTGGITNSNLDYSSISANLAQLKNVNRFQFITLSEMAHVARKDLLTSTDKNSAKEKDAQVKASYTAVLGSDRNESQSFYLQNMIPQGINNLMDLGCGAGYWSERISKLFPGLTVIGVDWGKDFIDAANRNYAAEKVSFQVQNFESLSFPDGKFDCVYADNVLEHAFNIDQTLKEVYRVLSPGGILVAALPSDARNPLKICVDHNWKTAPHEILLRLENAGFFNININEIDTFRKLGMPPYPPSDDKMCYIKACK